MTEPRSPSRALRRLKKQAIALAVVAIPLSGHAAERKECGHYQVKTFFGYCIDRSGQSSGATRKADSPRAAPSAPSVSVTASSPAPSVSVQSVSVQAPSAPSTPPSNPPSSPPAVTPPDNGPPGNPPGDHDHNCGGGHGDHNHSGENNGDHGDHGHGHGGKK